MSRLKRFFPRTPEYQTFLDAQANIYLEVGVVRVMDGLSLNETTDASLQEIGWTRKEQVAKAIHQARYGKLTPEMFKYLKKKTGNSYLDRNRRAKVKKLWEDLGYWPE